MPRWEDVRVGGGPHGKNTEIWVGGEKVPGLIHAELHFDVADVVLLKLTKVVEATYAYEGQAFIEEAVKVRVNEKFGEEGWVVVAESTADTVWQALYDCARQLELAARKDGQGVAQAGTIVEPDGRPPGQ